MGEPMDNANLKFDPFLTRIGEPGSDPAGGTAGYRGPASEDQPLMSDNGVPVSKGGEAKLMILPTACCMMTQTVVSVAALALSFSETGHRSGYEEGGLDADSQSSGCEGAFYWLMVQAALDLLITCFTCLFLVSPLKAEPVGVHGCAATVRLCTLAAGFHILYFSGLKRDMCDPFLIIWSTILVWTGAGVMIIAGCLLTCMLLGATSSGHPQYRQPRRAPQVVKGPPVAYQTTYQSQGVRI